MVWTGVRSRTKRGNEVTNCRRCWASKTQIFVGGVGRPRLESLWAVLGVRSLPEGARRERLRAGADTWDARRDFQDVLLGAEGSEAAAACRRSRSSETVR
jgi:hypothetical protein